MKLVHVELANFLDTNPSTNEIKTWFAAKITMNAVHVKQLQAVENFCEERRLEMQAARKDEREARKTFYQQQAASLNPPIDLYTLQECKSYQRAIAQSKPSADALRSWNTLFPKIREELHEVREKLRKREREEIDAFLKASQEREEREIEAQYREHWPGFYR